MLSLHVTILSGHSGWECATQAYCILRANDCAFRTEYVRCRAGVFAWNQLIELQLNSSVRSVVMEMYGKRVMKPDKLLGAAVIPLRTIPFGSPSPPRWYAVHREWDDTELSKSGLSQVQLTVCLHARLADFTGQTRPHDPPHSAPVPCFVRRKVSKQKRRFEADGFDLDLSYITNRIIAMGFPSQKFESMYRNKLTTVQRFFNQRHPKLYKIYNLCSERDYDPHLFANVACYPFDDHNPCRFEMIQRFCDDVEVWLGGDPERVAAVHCKAGKGRTGLLVSCYLMHSGVCATPDEALAFYADKRTKNRKGVTIPSQIRYVHYYGLSLKQKRCARNVSDEHRSKKSSSNQEADAEKSSSGVASSHTPEIGRRQSVPSSPRCPDLHLNLPSPAARTDHPFLPVPRPSLAKLVWIKISPLPSALISSSVHLVFALTSWPHRQQTPVAFSSRSCDVQPTRNAATGGCTFDCSQLPCALVGDSCLVVSFAPAGQAKFVKLLQVWFHPRFELTDSAMSILRFRKYELDNACKDKKHKILPQDLVLELGVQWAASVSNANPSPGPGTECSQELSTDSTGSEGAVTFHTGT